MARSIKEPRPLLPLVMVAVGLPMALNLVPPNGFYGFRTATTLASPETWYAANSAAGLAAVMFGLLGIAINFAVVRSPRLTPVQRHLVPVGTLILAVFAMTAGSTAA